MKPFTIVVLWVAGSLLILIGIWIWTAMARARGSNADLDDVWFFGTAIAILWPVLVPLFGLFSGVYKLCKKLDEKLVLTFAKTRVEQKSDPRDDTIKLLEDRIRALENGASYRELRRVK